MIKGMELDNFLLTSFYIGFGVKVRFPQYAQVKYIDRKLVVGICSTLTALSLDQFIIETDLETDKVKLQLSLPLFEELKATSFDISKRHRSNFIYPMTDTYYLNYPFRGAWDEETDETLDKEVLKSWFQSNHQELEQNKIFTQVITKNRALINDLFQFSLRPDYHIEISEFLDVSFLKQALPLKTPQIIFVDISETKGNSSKDDHDLKNLIGLIAIINNISNYNPILVISNNKSKSEALRKAYNYPNIIVTPEKLNVETFELLATSYSESYSSDDSSPELHYFKIMDERRAVMVDQQILVTSLSEHKVTFISEAELPIYSVLHFLLPFDFYVTIVPDLEQLVQKENVTHYTGVIHGLTESSIQNLRRFINLIYFNPLEEFTPEHIQAILGQKEIKEEIIVDIDTDKESITDEMIEEEEDNWNRTFKRPTLKGKSKL